MKNVGVYIGVMLLLWGCGVSHKAGKQEKRQERVRIGMICQDSMDIRELYRRLSGKRVVLNRLELGIPDTLARQYVNAVTRVVIEEDTKEERVMELRSGSDVQAERMEDRSMEKMGEWEVKTGKGLFFWVMVVLLSVAGGVGGYLCCRRIVWSSK